MQEIETLIEKASHFKGLGVTGVMRDKSERLAFFQFHDDIEKPIKRKGCSSCVMQAFFKLETNLKNHLLSKKTIKDTMSQKEKVTYKLRSDIPNIKGYDGNVYNKETLTQEIAQGIVERYPDFWSNWLDVDVSEKPKRKYNKKTTETDSETRSEGK